MLEGILVLGGVVGTVLAASGVAAFSLAGSVLHICQPNEVLIFSGRRQPDGKGYYAVKGGRGWRVPLVERVDRLDLTNMIIDLEVRGAYSKGGIPLNVDGVANIKIAGEEPRLGAAVERLLGKTREEIAKIAKDVLEGNLRGVLSQLTPEEVNEDKRAFEEKLLEEAHEDLNKLGLLLDTMKIQNVWDERGYLDSIGRKQSAEIIKRSRIAEANAKAQAITRDSGNRQRARLQQVDAEEQIAIAKAERRIQDARGRGVAMVAESEGQVKSEIAKATAALEAEEARVEMVRRRLEADVIEPARADMEAGINAARGRSATILEQGRANVQVLDEMIKVWNEAGPSARDIFLMQKLNSVMTQLVSTVGIVKIDKITMLPSGGDAGGSGDVARRAVRLVEELKGAIGVDLPQLLEAAVASRNPPALPGPRKDL
jgi:flotillin